MNFRIPNALIIKIKSYLKKGGIIAYATESCFGLGTLPKRHDSLLRLLHLKKRNYTKGLIVIGYELEQFHTLIKPLSSKNKILLQQTWPAAKTFLVSCKTTVSPLLKGTQRKKLAIRIPDHAQARFLCQQIKSPLVSTSANLSHQKTCKTIREVKRRFSNKILIVPGLIGRDKKSSAIFDLTTLKKIR